MYAVVLAGGGGTRLWPLSSVERPKPFLPLLGERSLLQLTVERIGGLVDPDDIYVVTDRRYDALVRDQLPGVGVIAEPLGRNTAAAIALATAAIARPEGDVMAVLPADHWIADPAAFRDTLCGAVRLAAGSFGVEAPLVTLGVRPSGPATAYGYLLPRRDQRETIAGVDACPLHAFEEKPTEVRARELLATEGAVWNAGIFVWQRSAIRAAIERYTSLMTAIDPAIGSELGLQLVYEHLAAVSIDVAVMEGAARDRRVVMATMNAGWSDLGSWTALLAALPGHRARLSSGRVVPSGEVVELGAEDLLVRREEGQLELVEGPTGGLRSGSPMALLKSARPDLRPLRALLERATRLEPARARP